MENDWEELTWGDIAKIEYGKALRDYSSGEYPVYGTNGRIGFTTCPLYFKPSVIIGRKGAYRGIHLALKPFFVIDTAFYLNPEVDIDIRWAYYQLLTQDINGLDSGSAIPSTSRDSFYSLPVSMPPLPTQKAIAHILGTIDDKIELLRQINETLEAIAKVLFKSWFVDFDPVRKKAEGLPSGLPPEIDALFPDSFEDSELGKIPKGWEIGSINQYCTVIKELLSPDQFSGIENYVGLEHIPRKSIALLSFGNSEDLESNKAQFIEDDILFGKLRPYFHKVVFAPEYGICSTDILVIRPSERDNFCFCLMHLSSEAMIDYASSYSNGTKMPRASWNDIQNYKVAAPPQKLIQYYNNISIYQLKLIKINSKENKVLVKIRDALLPKLISGDLEVKDIDKILEPAT